MTRKNNVDMEIVLAKVEERLDGCMLNRANEFNRLQKTTDQIQNSINEINNLLLNGEHKISDVRGIILNHIDNHERQDKKLLQQIKLIFSFMSIIIAIITITVNILI